MSTPEPLLRPPRPRLSLRAVLAAALALAAVALVGGRLASSRRASAAPVRAPSAAGPATAAAEATLERAPEVRSRTALEGGDPMPVVGAVPPADVPTGAQRSAGSATLAVLVVEHPSGRPLPGARLLLADAFTLDAPRVARADDQGRAALDVPTERALLVEASGSDDDVGVATARVEPLRPGERREVVLELPTGLDAAFHGRVVDPAGHPVPGAAVWLQRDRTVSSRDDADSRVTFSPERHRGSPIPQRRYQADVFDRTASDADGRFELHFSSWKGFHLRVEKPGYPLVVAWLDAGHATRGTASTIRLTEGGRLEARVLDVAGGPVAGCTVRLSCEGHDIAPPTDGPTVALGEVEWTATTDATGAATLPALPERLPLRVELWRDGRRVRSDPERLVLAPGEVRVREWRLGAGAALFGWLVDGTGAPVAAHEIWLLPCTRAARAQRLLTVGDRDEVVARARTDGAGAFRFEDVPAGTWWVGPEGSPELAPLAARVELLEGGPAGSVTLTVSSALSIAGTVRRADGSPAADVVLLASSARFTGSATAWSDSDGEFVLGPLPPGDFQVRTLFANAPAAAVVVPSGTRDLEIVLAAPSALEGVVADGAGRENAARVFVSRGPWEEMMETEASDGRFRFTGLEPGSYGLCASTDDGRVATLSDLPLGAGAELRDLALRLEPGGRLALRYEGPADLVQVLALGRGVVVYANGLRAGTEREFTVPPGEVRVLRRTPGGAVAERTLEVAVGERAELVLRD